MSDDEALERAVQIGGDAWAVRMQWHPTRSDHDMARVVLEVARQALEDPLRAEIARQTNHRDETRRMLRMACKELGDNDWPDNLHHADVIEKHLVRPIRNLLADVADSGVVLDDARLRYVTVQIDRSTWVAIRDMRGADGYKAARGVVPVPPGSPSPEDAIRRLRGR